MNRPFRVISNAPQVPQLTLERVFDNGEIGTYGSRIKEDDGDYSLYEFTVQALINDAFAFEEDTLAPARDENLRYFYAEEPPVESEGTSKVVSTDFRDTVMQIIPSLIRIFTGPEHVVNCLPNYEGQEDAAKQCMDYLQYMFWVDNPGFLILHDILKNALRCRIGVVYWYTETHQEITEQVYHNLTPGQFQYLIYENPTVEVVEQTQNEYGGLDVRLRFSVSKPQTCIESVPPDEFRIDRRAKSIKTATLVGWDRIVPVGDLIEMGYDPEDLEPFLGATPNYSSDRLYRNLGLDNANVLENFDVRYGCYYIRIDRDGDGIPELREIHTIGDHHAILYDEVAQHPNFACWSPDPEPHTVVGDSPAEMTKDIQDIKTNMLRGSLDSLANSLWPRTAFNETLVTAEDVLNEEIGAAIRTRGNPSETLQQFEHTFVGQPVFQMFEQMEILRQQRTGINNASRGLDPKALQSTALQGVDSIISGDQERIELIARILAETGLKDLMAGLLRECVNSPNQIRTVQLRGKWVDVNPSTFDPNYRMEVNPTLGRGSDMTRLMALTEVKNTQIMAFEKFGVDNPLCGPIEFRNVLEDMMAIANVKNVGRYFKPINQDVVDQINAQPKEPDPAILLAQAEIEKTRAKMASDIAKDNRENRKLRLDEDFRRDQLAVTGILDAAKIEADTAYDINEQELERLALAQDVETGNADRAQQVLNADADRNFQAGQADADRREERANGREEAS